MVKYISHWLQTMRQQQIISMLKRRPVQRQVWNWMFQILIIFVSSVSNRTDRVTLGAVNNTPRRVYSVDQVIMSFFLAKYDLGETAAVQTGWAIDFT